VRRTWFRTEDMVSCGGHDFVRRTWFRAEDMVSCGGYVSGEGRYSIVGFRKQISNTSIDRIQKGDAAFAKLFGRMCSALWSWVGNRPTAVCECDGSNRLDAHDFIVLWLGDKPAYAVR
jgi:hypothetical protein